MSTTRINWRNSYSGSRLLLPLLALFFAVGCDKPNINFGTNFVTNNNTNIIIVDTFTAALSTVALDSFPTAGTGHMLIGGYNDPFFGNIQTSSYLQLGIPSNPVVTFQSAFDSIAFIMRVNNTYFGDTTLQQRYYVSQLDTPILLPPQPAQQTTFYNTSSIPFSSTPLGSVDINIKPTAGITGQSAKDSVKIRLPDALGRQLLDLLFRKSDSVTNLTSFLHFFRGLYISADSTKKGVIYDFKDSAIVRLYYHEPGASFNYLHIDFPLNNGAYQFNHVDVDRSSTPLAAINSAQSTRINPLTPAEVPSSVTNHAAYVQSMTGLQIKVTFPTILTLTQFPDYIGILKAEVILKPLPGSYSPNTPLPPQLIASQTNQTNQLGGTLTFANAIEYGSLVTDYVTGQNTSYTYDVTNYLMQQLTIQGNNQNALMLNIPAPADHTSFDRAVLGDKSNRVYNVLLRIYYISLPH